MARARDINWVIEVPPGAEMSESWLPELHLGEEITFPWSPGQESAQTAMVEIAIPVNWMARMSEVAKSCLCRLTGRRPKWRLGRWIVRRRMSRVTPTEDGFLFEAVKEE